MAKEVKKAEMALIDADKFPKESFRERLARKYGLDAVALSGPCEGQPLVDCIVNQLEKRWDRIRSRFAGNNNKALKLAVKLAESYMAKDDTEKCEKDLHSIGYQKEAASGIASYLKAYAMDSAADMDMDNSMDEVSAEPEMDAPPGEAMGGDDDDSMDMNGDGGDDAAPAPADAAPDMGGDMAGDMDVGGAAPADEGMGATVSIELPAELVEQLTNAIVDQAGNGGADMGGGDMPPMGDDMGGDMGDSGIGGAPGADAGMAIEVIDDSAPGGDLHGDAGGDEIVPGEPAADNGNVVEGEGEESMMGGGGMQMANHGKPHGQGACEACGHKMASHDPMHEKKEHATIEKLDKNIDALKAHEAKEHAYAGMRSGHLKKVAAESVLRLGPEMAINNTDQLGGHDDKKLGNAKEKGVEEPKPIADGNLETEGFSAGDKKFQDGGTMGREQKFDAKPFDKASATGGNASIMGKDEAYPEGKPQVPAGSSPIGGEVWQGGDLTTKGTVIATITPKGVVVEASGKKFLAKGEIKLAMVEKIEAGLKKIAEADGRKFAEAAFKVIKEAEESGKVDGVTKIDTAKLESEKFTNDADKKPEEGGAMTGKGKAAKSEDHPTTDTSKKEAEHFQNDADKKPEGEKKAAADEKETKLAKAVEEPKPIADGNLETEGYSAGDKKFQDNKTMGHEEKFDAKTIDKSEVSKGSASLMGKDESLPEGKPDVPAGGGKIGNEEWDGGDVSTKGTVIAENQSQNRVSADDKAKTNEATIREARLKAASVYVADLLRHNDIREDEYSKELEKVAAMSVPAIHNLIAHTKQMRTRIVASAVEAQKQEGKMAGLSIPVVITASKNETSLKDRLVSEFKLTKTLDQIDDMKK